LGAGRPRAHVDRSERCRFYSILPASFCLLFATAVHEGGRRGAGGCTTYSTRLTKCHLWAPSLSADSTGKNWHKPGGGGQRTAGGRREGGEETREEVRKIQFCGAHSGRPPPSTTATRGKTCWALLQPSCTLCPVRQGETSVWGVEGVRRGGGGWAWVPCS
jgi:hypothetical protein